MKGMVAQINPTIGDLNGNGEKIIAACKRARKTQAHFVVFPELSLTGYFPDDLLLDSAFIDQVEKILEKIASETKDLLAIVGLPRRSTGGEKPLHNSAALLIDGKVAGYQDKILLPTYDVFDERRYFEPGKECKVWHYMGRKIGVTICEDAWQHGKSVDETNYSIDPIAQFKKENIDLLINISGSPYSYGRKRVRKEVFMKASQTLHCPLFVSNQVGANDSLIFDGHSFVLDANGEVVQMGQGFVEDDLLVDLDFLFFSTKKETTDLFDLYEALCLGVKDYFQKQGFSKALVGLSGGIDSTLVACIAKDALGSDNVMGISLPTRYNAPSGLADIKNLATNLKIDLKIISIDQIFQHYLDLLSKEFQALACDITEQNLQSRIRGNMLMAFANQYGLILLNTGNKSEMATGYATLYGDMAGGLAVLQDVTKLQVYRLAEHVNREKEIIPQAIIDKVPTAELKEDQTDFDTLPPFELLDPILEDYVEGQMSEEEVVKKHGFDPSFVHEIIKKVHKAEYKRRQAALGLRVTQKAFTKGRIVPIVQKWK